MSDGTTAAKLELQIISFLNKRQKALYALSIQLILCKYFFLVSHVILTGTLHNSVLHMPDLYV